jgi:small subunit ribosomal protein S4
MVKVKEPAKRGAPQRKRRKKQSEYAIQLREKQKVKRFYGLMEKQFRECYREADRVPGITGLKLIHLLEMRLDNIVYRLNFAVSRPEARQIVVLGHVLVNGKKVTIPSYRLRIGDTVEIKNKDLKSVAEAVKVQKSGKVHWVEVDESALKGRLLSLPEINELEVTVQPQLIVELYSK